MRTLSIVIFLLSVFTLSAQDFPSENWYVGNVTLTSGEQKEGVIKYDLESNSIQINIDNKIETYHASQFITFTILMKKEELRRSFYVLPYANVAGYKRPTIFELIHEGQTSLVAREYIATRNMNAGSNFYNSRFGGFNDPYNRTFRQRYLAFRLFLVDNQGAVTPLSAKRNDVIAALGDHQKELKRFIKDNKLKMDRVPDMADLIAYYNNLTS